MILMHKMVYAKYLVSCLACTGLFILFSPKTPGTQNYTQQGAQ